MGERPEERSESMPCRNWNTDGIKHNDGTRTVRRLFACRESLREDNLASPTLALITLA